MRIASVDEVLKLKTRKKSEFIYKNHLIPISRQEVNKIGK